MFTIKIVSRTRIADNWYEDKRIITCDYVDIRSGYSETTVTGRMNCGAIAVHSRVTNEPLVADSEMKNGDEQITHIVIENLKGKTTEVIKAPRCYDVPRPE